MRKLMYKFHDGKVVSTLVEAKNYKATTGFEFCEFFEDVKIPTDKDISDGITLKKAGFKKYIS